MRIENPPENRKDTKIIKLEEEIVRHRHLSEQLSTLQTEMKAIIQQTREASLEAISRVFKGDPEEQRAWVESIINSPTALGMWEKEVEDLLRSNAKAEVMDAKSKEIEIKVRERLGTSASEEDITTLVTSENERQELW